jgi:hypothetical protein
MILGSLFQSYGADLAMRCLYCLETIPDTVVFIVSNSMPMYLGSNKLFCEECALVFFFFFFFFLERR